MISSKAILGALLAILGIVWMIFSAIGIRRKQSESDGKRARHGKHGHDAV